MMTLQTSSRARKLKLYGNIVVRAIAPILLALSIALPEYLHFKIERNPPALDVIELLTMEPSTEILEELSDMTLAVSLGIPQAERTATAREILSGRVTVPSFLATPISLAGWPRDLIHGGPTLQLALASLTLEDLLLETFEREREAKYYQFARDRILAFAAWEADQREPIAFLWNDHAVAARIRVLIRLWRHLREDAQATAMQKAAVIALVVRSGELLVKDSQFTVRTNHGVMQNIALLQIGAAFPALPKIDQWRKLALARLEMQLGFYVSDEGVVLEHSAEYQLLGEELLAYASRLAYLNGIEPSQRLRLASNGAERFTKHLIRPDGSVPLFGNTAAGTFPLIATASSDGRSPVEYQFPPFQTHPSEALVYPLSGYAIWWFSEPVPSQTVVAWAKHDRHGHKHADEVSLHFWSRGYNWITATGYWPYGEEGFAEANGWRGSNAPHEPNEAAESVRTVRLVGHGESSTAKAVDLEVQRHTGMKARRQIIQLGGEEILILDFIDAARAGAETLWTVDHRLTMSKVNSTHFISESRLNDKYLQIMISSNGSELTRTELLRGSLSPFGGWVVVGRKPQPAPGIRVLSHGLHTITATMIALTDEKSPISLKILEASSGENWSVSMLNSGHSIGVKRRGNTIFYSGSKEWSENIELVTPEIMDARAESLKASMNEALKRYPPWRDLSFYHQRLYMLIFGVWLLGEIVIGRLDAHGRKGSWHNFGIIFSWIVIGTWVHFSYLI